MRRSRYRPAVICRLDSTARTLFVVGRAMQNHATPSDFLPYVPGGRTRKMSIPGQIVPARCNSAGKLAAPERNSS
jgi:hypothetical protein